MPIFQRRGHQVGSSFAGLEQLLDSVKDDQGQDADTEAWCEALRDLLSRKPANMLQELKSLVGRFSRQGRPHKADWGTAPMPGSPGQPLQVFLVMAIGSSPSRTLGIISCLRQAGIRACCQFGVYGFLQISVDYPDP